jgi:hypothetical protein
MASTVSRWWRELSAERFLCCQAMIDDVRAAGSNRESTVAVVESLLAAFSDGTVGDWRVAVRALDELLAATAVTASAAAHRRLQQFVAENADLLVDA